MAANNPKPIPEIVKDLLAYNPDTGLLTWKMSRRGTVKAGGIAGTVNDDGYIRVKVKQKFYPSHRIAWFIYHGQQPEGQLDHIDNDKTNNRISNLRLATPIQNNQNIGKTSSCTSGVKNVTWQKGAWQVVIKVNGKPMYFGRFQNLFEARERAIEVRKRYHGDFANHGDR